MAVAVLIELTGVAQAWRNLSQQRSHPQDLLGSLSTAPGASTAAPPVCACGQPRRWWHWKGHSCCPLPSRAAIHLCSLPGCCSKHLFQHLIHIKLPSPTTSQLLSEAGRGCIAPAVPRGPGIHTLGRALPQGSRELRTRACSSAGVGAEPHLFGTQWWFRNLI